MGTVDLVLKRDGGFARVYVMKRLHDHFAIDGAVRAMFLEEARIAGLLRHANVVSVIDVGEDDDGPYLVMDYIEGVPLNAFLARAAQDEELLPVEICVDIAKQVAEGLRAAHELVAPGGKAARVIHRDVSPTNVLLGFDGVVRVTDFGIARALGTSRQTQSGRIAGKPGYVSPEQLRFEPVSEQTDLYALGVVLFELLATRRLYPGGINQVMARILDEPPPDIGEVRDDVPADLVELVFELLSKDPAGRPVDARSVAKRLSAIYLDVAAGGDPISLADYLEEHHQGEREEMLGEISRVLEDRDPTQAAAALPDFADETYIPTQTRPDGEIPPTRVLEEAPPPDEETTQIPATRVQAPRPRAELAETPVVDRPRPQPAKGSGANAGLFLLVGALVVSIVVAGGLWLSSEGDDEAPPTETRLEAPVVSTTPTPSEDERREADGHEESTTSTPVETTEETAIDDGAAAGEPEPTMAARRRRRRIAPMMTESTMMGGAPTWEWDG
jgi:serine/threonine-protein kinase